MVCRTADPGAHGALPGLHMVALETPVHRV